MRLSRRLQPDAYLPAALGGLLIVPITLIALDDGGDLGWGLL